MGLGRVARRSLRAAVLVTLMVIATASLMFYLSAPAAAGRSESEPPVEIDSSDDPSTPIPPPVDPGSAEPAAPQPEAEPVDPGPAPGPWESWSWDALNGIDRSMADPAALYADGQFHVYATSSRECAFGACSTLWVPRLAGPSLAAPGLLQGDAMPGLPAWVNPSERDIWAPAVVRNGDRYIMYFAATAGISSYNGAKCLGAAVSATPQGPFVPEPRPLHCVQGPWSIDPYAVSDGSHWFLLWREDDSAHMTGKIVGAALTADGLTLVADTQRTLLTGEYGWEEGYPDNPAAVSSSGSSTTTSSGQVGSDVNGMRGPDTSTAVPSTTSSATTAAAAAAGRSSTAAGRIQPAARRGSPGIGPVENPAMAKHPTTGEWLLTWSGNRWETANYATGLAVCDSPLGPCRRVSHDTPWLRISSDSGISTSASFVGSGGLSFVAGPNGRLYAVFHAYRGTASPGSGAVRVGWAYAVEARNGAYVLAQT
jgi:hypothetical protein